LKKLEELLTEQAPQTPTQQKGLLKLLGYDFIYKPGKDNIAVDSLSRSLLMAWSQPQLQIVSWLKTAIMENSKLKTISGTMQEESKSYALHSTR